MGRFPVSQRISLRRLAAEEGKDAPIQTDSRYAVCAVPAAQEIFLEKLG